ncbi:hypothetical protein [Pedobacter sp. SYP-B3415]|uniref:hypothetical protein n=1 Tax=Pedobacter sp. SYP-B3415 TaxID=2496641 RepID=UPI00101D8243|nr:hypothetical protein [Pedobacter sp. SYP-B3415]
MLTALYGMNTFFDRGLRLSKEAEHTVWNDIFDGKVDAGILVMGNSRAFVNVSSLILQDNLGQRAYNLGMDGADFNLCKMRYEVAISRNRAPKLLVVVLGFEDLQLNAVLPNKQQLLPYLQDKIIQSSIAPYKNCYNIWDQELPLLKYRHHLQSLSESLKLYLGKQPHDLRIQGYQARDYKWIETFSAPKQFNLKQELITPALQDMLEKFVKAQRRAGIEVVMVIPPEHQTVRIYFPNRRKVYQVYKQIAQKHQVRILDYSDSMMSEQRKFFYSPTHMNREGSTFFSKQLARDLRPAGN